MNQSTSNLNSPSWGRRGWILGSVASVAGLAGASLAWWRFSPADRDDAPPGNLWALEFDTPGAEKLGMEGLRGKKLLINFWATWCPPCVEELPLLDAFYRQNSSNGWQVIGLAVDKPRLVSEFLQRMPLGFPIAIAGMEGIGLTKSLGNTAGGLPFSVVLGSNGKILKRKIGKISAQELELWRALK